EGKYDAGSLRQKLFGLSGPSQKWPDDTEFESAWAYRQLYKGGSTRKVTSILEGLELALGQYGREFKFEFDKLSVEHILPQKWRVEDYPLPAETVDARETRARLLHSLGNMTLVTPNFNTALSNLSFKIKRPAIIDESVLKLNTYFGSSFLDDS